MFFRKHEVVHTDVGPYEGYVSVTAVCLTCRTVLVANASPEVAAYHEGTHLWLYAGYGWDAEELDP